MSWKMHNGFAAASNRTFADKATITYTKDGIFLRTVVEGDGVNVGATCDVPIEIVVELMEMAGWRVFAPAPVDLEDLERTLTGDVNNNIREDVRNLIREVRLLRARVAP